MLIFKLNQSGIIAEKLTSKYFGTPGISTFYPKFMADTSISSPLPAPHSNSVHCSHLPSSKYWLSYSISYGILNASTIPRVHAIRRQLEHRFDICMFVHDYHLLCRAHVAFDVKSVICCFQLSSNVCNQFS